jgi:hypothetical protein
MPEYRQFLHRQEIRNSGKIGGKWLSILLKKIHNINIYSISAENIRLWQTTKKCGDWCKQPKT